MGHILRDTILRFHLLVWLAVLCGNLLAFSPGRALAAERAPIVGQWSGTYSCEGIRDNHFDLTVTADDDGTLEGVFTFPVPGKDARGSYSLRGLYQDADRSFRMMPTRWIERPLGLSPLGIDGSVRDNRLAIGGNLIGCGGAAAFAADRVGAEDKASSDMGATGGKATAASVEGKWEGVISCKPRFRFPYRLTIYQNGSELEAVASLKSELSTIRSGATLLSGPAGGGAVVLHVDQRGQAFLNGPAAAAFSGRLAADGKHLEGKVSMVLGCDPVVLTHTGPAALDNVFGLKDLVGEWQGYDLDDTTNPTNATMPPSFPLRSTSDGGRTSALAIEIVEEGGSVVVRYRASNPITAVPTHRDRLMATFRPIAVLDNGSVVFMPVDIQTIEGVFRQRAAQGKTAGPLLLLFPDGDGIAGQRIDDRVGRKFTLSPVSKGADFSRLAVEGPPIALPAPFDQGTLAKAATLDAQCQALAAWSAPVEVNDPGRLSDGDILKLMLPGFADEQFARLFGISYGLTSDAGRIGIGKFADEICVPRLGAPKGLHALAEAAFFRRPNFETIVAALANTQDSASWAQRAITELKGLPETETALDRLAALEAEAAARAAELGDNEE
jgi:hypothetical protein